MSRSIRLAAAAAAFASAALLPAGSGAADGRASRSNILFVILDDVGIDQMRSFGFGGLNPPRLPVIEKIAAEGIRFTNVWGMPECSSSRAAYFTGRFPSHNGVGMAILENHLPQTYVSPFETTLPRVLETVGYRSAMVGKYHLGDEQDPAGSCAPATRGFDAFYGNMTAGPPSIDETAGGVDPAGTQACGYAQTDDPGACYTRIGRRISCTEIEGSNVLARTSPSRTCLQKGGIFAANLTCSDPRPAGLDFSKSNAYYVWPRTTIVGERSPYTAKSCGVERQSRDYMSTVQASDGVSWWKSQRGLRMLTLSFNAIHAPFQKAPTTLVADPLDRTAACNSLMPERFLVNSVFEGADAALGRAMAGMGLATLKADGTVDKLHLGTTLVVIVGDNGSFGPSVRVAEGFDAGRSKGTVYQTGVWVPLIVAGGPVKSPGRTVDALVNITDLYRLFTQVAGVDADTAVPPSHKLDGEPMLRYLTHPRTPPVRTVNFSEVNPGEFSPDPEQRSWPCVIGNACSETLFPEAEFCEDNGGTWYGEGADEEFTSCCAVQAAFPDLGITVMPVAQKTARTATHKLVRSTNFACDTPLAGSGQAPALPWAEFATTTADEFYDVRRTPGNPVGIDAPEADLLAGCTAADPADCLPQALRGTYRTLAGEVDRIVRSADEDAACRAKGDGNMDQRISRADLVGYRAFAGEGPSRYDINVDGETDEDDLAIIRANMGTDCMSICTRADLDRDGDLDERDYRLILRQSGTCDVITCSGDLDGDRKVRQSDRRIFRAAEKACTAAASVVSLTDLERGLARP
jgi:hypothetical protein